MMNIPFSTVKMMHEEIETEMLKNFREVYENHWFIQCREWKVDQ